VSSDLEDRFRVRQRDEYIRSVKLRCFTLPWSPKLQEKKIKAKNNNNFKV
jgi:hypothetical protein